MIKQSVGCLCCLLAFAVSLCLAPVCADEPQRASPTEGVCEQTGLKYCWYAPVAREGAPPSVLFFFHGYVGRNEGVYRAGGRAPAWQNLADERNFILVSMQDARTVFADYRSVEEGRKALDRIERAIMSAQNDLSEDCTFHEGRTMLAGFSSGGKTAAALVMRNPHRYIGLGMFGPTFQPTFLTALTALDDAVQHPEYAKRMSRVGVYYSMGRADKPRRLQSLRTSRKFWETHLKVGEYRETLYDGLQHEVGKGLHDFVAFVDERRKAQADRSLEMLRGVANRSRRRLSARQVAAVDRAWCIGAESDPDGSILKLWTRAREQLESAVIRVGETPERKRPGAIEKLLRDYATSPTLLSVAERRLAFLR